MNKVKIMAVMIVATMFCIISYRSIGMEKPKRQEKPIYEIIAGKEAKEFAGELQEMAELESEKFDYQNAFDEEHGRLAQQYKKYEGHWENLKKDERIREFRGCQLHGGINYLMTLDEMEQRAKEKFVRMKQRGLILSEKEFEDIKHNYLVPEEEQRKRKKEVVAWPSTTDLTRIWGADYLKNEIKRLGNLQSFDVPNYVIVADNPDNIKVELGFRKPLFSSIAFLQNAHVYFEKITGEYVGHYYRDSALSKVGFKDFNPSNIIKSDPTRKNYIVDTEAKSFDYQPTSKIRKLFEYASKKFKYLNNNIESCTFDIDLREK